MPSEFTSNWRAMGRIAQAFLVITAVFTVIHFLHVNLIAQIVAGSVTVLLGLIAAYQLARKGARRAIWRLRTSAFSMFFAARSSVILVAASTSPNLPHSVLTAPST